MRFIMGRFIRIVKADEAPRKTNKNYAQMNEKERAIFDGQVALRPYLQNLMKNPPMKDDEIDYDALYSDIIYANNHMFAELFDLDDDARYKAIKDEEGNITTPSIMALPMLTQPVLTALDGMIKHFGEELGFRKQMDEEDHGSLEDFMKKNRVPNQIGKWMREGIDASGRKREQQQKGVLNHLKNKSKHPISTSTLRDMEDIQVSPRAVRVVPSRGGTMPDYFQQQMDEASAQGRKALSELTADGRYTTDEGRMEAARKLYEKVLPQVDFKTMDLEESKVASSDVAKWRNLITNKAQQEGVSEKDAVPLVQEDVNNFMRIFLQERAIGSAGRGGRFGREAIAGQGPDFVTHAFHRAAKNVGRSITQPNADERYAEPFIKDPNNPTSKKRRLEIADGDIEVEDMTGLHPALQRALSETGIFRTINEAEGVSRQETADLTASGTQIAEKGGEKTVGTQLSDIKLDTPQDQARARRFISSDRQGEQKIKSDYRLKDLENMVLFGDMTNDEYQVHYNQILNDVSGRAYNPTYFSEIPDGSDFPEGHPYRDLSAGEIEEKSRIFMDLLVGSGRHMMQFNNHLEKLGMDRGEVEKLALHADDMDHLHTILHSDDPYAELGRFNDKDKSRYERVLETGLKPGYLNKLNHDLLDLRKTVSEIGIDPIDIAEMGMEYAKSGFSVQGYRNGFMKLLGKFGGDVSKGAVLRTLYAWKRSNDARAKGLARHQEVKEQKQQFREHYQMSPEERVENKIEKEACKACDIKHFANETKEEAQGHHPYRPRGVSPYALSRIYMPELDYRWDDDDSRSRSIPLMGNDDEISLLTIAKYIFADDDDEYIGQMLRRYGLTQRDGSPLQTDDGVIDTKGIDRRGGELKKYLKKQIEKAIVHPSSPHHDRAEAIGHEFGLDMRDRPRGKRGAARRTPHERQALGLIHASAFQNDAQREESRIRNLTAAQFSGVVEAFDILQDIKSGALTTPEGKRINLKSLTKMDRKGNDRSRKERRKFIASMFGEANAAKRAESKARRYNSFLQHIQPSIDEWEDYQKSFKEEYGQRMENGDLSKKSNPEGHAKLKARLKEMRELAKQDILASMNQIKEKKMRLANRGVAGRDYVEVSAKDFHLHGVVSNGMKINIGGQENAVVDIRPPKYDDQNYALKLEVPLTQDVPVANDDDFHEDSGMQITEPNHSNKLISFEMRSAAEKKALNGEIENLPEFLKTIKSRAGSHDKTANRLAKDVDYDNHRTEQAFGAFLKIGHLLAPLLGKKDDQHLRNKLSALTTQLYTSKDGLPIPDVFLADGYGDEHRSFMYRPDEYMTGAIGQSVGTGLTHQQNNRLLYGLTDAETLQALSLKQHGRKLTKKQLTLANDAFHNEDNADWNKELIDDVLGTQEEEIPQEEIPPSGKMREHQVRELLQREAYDTEGKQENWVMNSATGCGLCGGSGKVTMDDAISFIQAHNPALAGANPNGPKMQDYIHKNLRATNHGDFDSHHSDMRGHEFPGVACPECDQEHPDAEGGRCSDGMCAHCHGSGYLDPDQVDEYFGGYVDEETGEVFHGHKHSPHYGEHYDENGLNAMIQQRLDEEGVGKTGRNNFTAKMHRDAVERGLALPLTKLKTIQALNKERYAKKAKIKMTEKDFNESGYYYSNAFSERSKAPEISDAKVNPIDDAMGVISESQEKLKGLRDAHHNNEILKRAEGMAAKAINNGASEEKVNNLLSVIQNHPNIAGSHGQRNHTVQTACAKLHNLMVKDYPKKYNEKGKANKKLFSLDDDKVQSESGMSHESLVYNHGRWLTDAENDEGIFAPNSKAEPHLSLKDLRDMFKHSKPMMDALNRYLHTSNFDEEKAEKTKEIVGQMKKPLVKQKLSEMSNPALSQLYDEFNAPDDVRDQENLEMEDGEIRWDQSLLDKLSAEGISYSSIKDYLSLEKEEGDSPRGGPRKGLDAGHKRAVNQIVKPMYVEFARLSMLKKFLESYDDISHPNFHKKVVDAMKANGNSADTRLSVENFFETVQMRGDLQTFAYNEAARMFGYDDEEDMERSIDLKNTKKDFGGGLTSGLDFKNDVLKNSKVSKSSAQKLPLEIDQLYQDSVAAQSSVTDESKARDEKIVAQMEEMALFRHYPNWMRMQAMTDLMGENGYGNASELRKDLENGEVSAELIEQIEGINAKATMFHPTITFGDYEDLETYDAVAYGEQQFGERLQGPATQRGTVPMSPSSRPIGQQATVGPQGEQMQTQPSGTAPQQGATGSTSDARTRLGSQAQQFAQRYPQAGEGPVQQPLPMTIRQPYDDKAAEPGQAGELPPFAFKPPQLPQNRFRQMPEDD